MASTNRVWLYLFILLIIVIFLWLVARYVNPFIDKSSQTVATALTQNP